VSLIFRLREERGTTLVLVTHDESLAARCDRRIHLRSGYIEKDERLVPIAAHS